MSNVRLWLAGGLALVAVFPAWLFAQGFDGRGFPGGGGGGGISQATADARYLKLAADNDPLTSSLDVTLDGASELYISTNNAHASGTASVYASAEAAFGSLSCNGTSNAGTALGVNDTDACDVIFDEASNARIYTTGAAPILIGTNATLAVTVEADGDTLFAGDVTSSAQIISTLNPANTTNTSSSLLANPAACDASEPLITAVVGSTTQFSADCEGDVVATTLTLDGASINTPAGSTTNLTFNPDGTADAVFNTDLLTVTDSATANGYVGVRAYNQSTGGFSAIYLGGTTGTEVGAFKYGQSGVSPVAARSVVQVSGTAVPVYVSRSDAVSAGTTVFGVVDDNGSGFNVLMTVDGEGNMKLASGATRSRGTSTLSGGTNTVTVTSGAVCVCSSTTANHAYCSVSGTTLTLNGTGTDVVSYICL